MEDRHAVQGIRVHDVCGELQKSWVSAVLNGGGQGSYMMGGHREEGDRVISEVRSKKLITEWLRLEGTYGGHLGQLPYSSRAT